MVTVDSQPVVEDWVDNVKMVLAEKRGKIDGITTKYPSTSDGKHKYFSLNAVDRIRVGATLFRLAQLCFALLSFVWFCPVFLFLLQGFIC